MISENAKNRPFINMEKCARTLTHTIRMLQSFLGDKKSSDTEAYYEAQKSLEESNIYYKEAIKEVSELIGPLPADASPGFIKWKENFLKGTGIVIENEEYGALKVELRNDGFLLRFLTPEEIDDLLRKHYESQQTGKRRLPNIKARIILDKIMNLRDEAETLEMKVREKVYQLR
jgi:hypothetical protein